MTFQIELDKNYNLMKVTPGFYYDLKISNAFINKHIASTASGISYRSVYCGSSISSVSIKCSNSDADTNAETFAIPQIPEISISTVESTGIDPLYIFLICLALIVIIIFFFVGYFRYKKNRTITDMYETATDEITPALNRKNQIDILYQKL